MGKIYINQASVVMYMHTNADLSQASNVYLQGESPTGSTFNQITCTIINADTGLVSVPVTNTTFPVAGTYSLWAYVVFTGGAESWGEPFHLNIYTPGT